MKFITFLLAAMPTVAHSDDEATNVTTLATVVVTASPITQEESVSKDGLETVSLSRSQLAALNAQDLQTALRQIPGVTISRYSPIGSYGGAQGGSIYIRGLGTARPGGEIRTYTDGVPRESGMWGHPLMDSMPIDFAESISVQKNPHPGRYPATFGAVDVETRRRHIEGYEGEADLAYGRYNTLLSASSAGLKEGAVDAYGGMSYKLSDGVRDHNLAILKSAFGRVGVDLSETEHLGFVYQRTDSKVEDPGEIYKPTPRTDRFDLGTDLYTTRFDTDRENLKGFSLFYFERGLIDWYQDNLCAGTMDGNAHTEWLNFGIRNFYDWNVWRDLWLSAGLDLTDEHGETETRNLVNGKVPFEKKGYLTTVSPYLGAHYDFHLDDDWTFTPSFGTRYYFHNRYDGELGPNAALTLDYQKKAQIFANGSRGVHYPGVYTLALSDNYAKDTLDAETMDYCSFGTKLSPAESFDILASVFHTEVHDRIDKTATGYINSGNMRATGLETAAHWRPTEDLTFFIGGTYTNPETEPVSRLPRWTYTAGGTWKICEYLQWTIDGQYVGSMYAYSVRGENELDLRRLEGDFLFNTRLAVPFESFSPFKGELYVSLENLTDRKFEYYPGYPMGGIMWYLGCRFRF